MSESLASSPGIPTLPLNILLSADSNITGERSKIAVNSFKSVSSIGQGSTVLKPLAMKRGFSSSSSSAPVQQFSKQLHLQSKQTSEIEKENQLTNLPSFSSSTSNSLTSSRSSNSGVFYPNSQEARMASNTSFGWSAQSSAFDSPKLLSPELQVDLQKIPIQSGENQQIPLAFLEMLQAEMLKECLKQQVIKEQEDEMAADSPKLSKKLKKTEGLKEHNEKKENKIIAAVEVTTEKNIEIKACEEGLEENNQDKQLEERQSNHFEKEIKEDNNHNHQITLKEQEDHHLEIEKNDFLARDQSQKSIIQTQQDNTIDGSSGEAQAIQLNDQSNEPRATETTTTTIPKNSKKLRVCNCKKTKCLKLYCDCFAAGEFCGVECNCSECSNSEAHSSQRDKVIEGLLEKNPFAFTSRQSAIMDIENLESKDQKKLASKKGCNCKRSGCLKKYCQCYQDGLQCGSHCKCNGCENCNESERQNTSNQGITSQESSVAKNDNNQSQISSNINTTFASFNQEIPQATAATAKNSKNNKNSIKHNQNSSFSQTQEANCNMNGMNTLFSNQQGFSRNTNSTSCQNSDYRNNQILNNNLHNDFNAANILELTRTIQQTPPDQLVVSLLTALLASQQQNAMFSSNLAIIQAQQVPGVGGQNASQQDKPNPLEALLLASANASLQNYQN